MRRYLPLTLRQLWRRYQPEPMESCSGAGLVFIAGLSLLTDDMSFNLRGWVTVATCAVTGSVMVLAAVQDWSSARRGDIVGVCALLWGYLVACSLYDLGFNPRQAAPAALCFGSLLSLLKDWDEHFRRQARDSA